MQAEASFDPASKAQIAFEEFPCGPCATESEQLLRSFEGVIEIDQGPAVRRISVTYDPDKITISSLLSALATLGLKAKVISVVIPMR